VFKTYPHLNYTLSLNAEADEVLDELSDCYENLTLFHRLADALKQGLPFAEFFEQTVQLFVEAGGYDFAHVEIADDCVEAELETLSQSTFFQQLHWASKPLLEQLADAPQLSWEAGTAVAALDPRTGLPTTGCAVPLMERQRRVGVLAVANGASGKGVLARDIRNLQSLAEIIGVGLTRSIMDRETTAHRIVEHEFDLAKRLQRQLMGGAAPVHDIGGYACFIESIPALDLAGDHAELKQSDHGLLHFAIIDVMGKGVPAAILAGIFRSHFLAWCDEALSAGQFLEKVNNALESQLGGQVLFITAFVGTINPLTGQCGYAGAGHPPALLLRSSGGVMELPSCGPPLGVMAGHAFEDRTVAIQHGDILMLITDGLYEWHYIDGRMFGWDAMRRWVEDQRSTSASGILHSLLEMIRQQGGSSHADDQTILMIQRKHD
jgi:serine phosphatase RsbU (regulator of sigma subunit)